MIALMMAMIAGVIMGMAVMAPCSLGHMMVISAAEIVGGRGCGDDAAVREVNVIRVVVVNMAEVNVIRVAVISMALKRAIVGGVRVDMAGGRVKPP